eukprot:gene2956-5806_t
MNSRMQWPRRSNRSPSPNTNRDNRESNDKEVAMKSPIEEDDKESEQRPLRNRFRFLSQRKGRKQQANVEMAVDEDVESNMPGTERDIPQTNKDKLQILEPMTAKDDISTRQKRVERVSVEGLPEIHLLGQLTSAIGVTDDGSEGITIRWKVDVPASWQLLGGDSSGQTQVSYGRMDRGGQESVPLNHPLDLHYAQTGYQDWGAARILVQAYKMDSFGRRILGGYGFIHLPFTSGFHKLELCLWRPVGSPEQEVAAYFLGRIPALVSDQDVLYDNAAGDRCDLVTMAAGKVYLEIFVIERIAPSEKSMIVMP